MLFNEIGATRSLHDTRKTARCSRPTEKPRKQIQHIFTVSHPGFGEWECKTRDLSLSGAFVEGRFVDIEPGETINLAFAAGTPAPVEYRFSSTVIRVATDRIGLEFPGLDMNTYGALLDLTLQG